MKDFFKNKGIKVAVVLLAVLVVMLLSTFISAGRTNLFANIVRTVRSPFKAGLSSIAIIWKALTTTCTIMIN
jgi:hypothetical protein